MKKLIQLCIISLLIAPFSHSVLAATDTSSPSSQATSSTTSTDAAATPTGTATPGAATQNKKMISTSNVLQQLQKAGFIVTNISFDKNNNQYTVDAVDKHGAKQSINVDAVQGLPADLKKVPHEIPLVQAVKKYEKNGSYVKSATIEGSDYKIGVIDNKGNEQNYTIDMKSGKAATAQSS